MSSRWKWACTQLALRRMQMTSLEFAFILLIMYYCMGGHLIFRLFQYYRWIATKENTEYQTKQSLMQLKSDFKEFIKLLTMNITYTTFLNINAQRRKKERIQSSNKSWRKILYSLWIPVFLLQAGLFWQLVSLWQTHQDNGFSQILVEKKPIEFALGFFFF